MALLLNSIFAGGINESQGQRRTTAPHGRESTSCKGDEKWGTRHYFNVTSLSTNSE